MTLLANVTGMTAVLMIKLSSGVCMRSLSIQILLVVGPRWPVLQAVNLLSTNTNLRYDLFSGSKSNVTTE